MGIPLRRRLARLRSHKIPAAFPILLIACLLFGSLWCSVNAYLRPAVETLAVSNATNRISKAVSEAVADCVTQQKLTYQDFVTLETDASGKITSLTSNLSSTSQLKSKLIGYIINELDGLQQEKFGVPLGTLTGWIIFSGKGPTIRVELLSVGDVTVQMHHNFSDAGINQTLHQVFLDVSATVYLLIPGETLSTTVDSQICVAETVIVGEVPETYLYVGNGEH